MVRRWNALGSARMRRRNVAEQFHLAAMTQNLKRLEEFLAGRAIKNRLKSTGEREKHREAVLLLTRLVVSRIWIADQISDGQETSLFLSYVPFISVCGKPYGKFTELRRRIGAYAGHNSVE